MLLRQRADMWFLLAVLIFVFAYSLPTLTTKPAYWYDEAINVELARNFADFGELDLVVAPNTFSGKGATVGSTGYPVTVPLAGFFKLFGFGLAQARVYMLLWMSALLVIFFFIAQKLWGSFVAYGGTVLIATFAPFYGNGRSVMGEIPGFLFFLLSLYALERRKWCLSGILLGLSVVSKPSVFIFLIPAYALVLLCRDDVWRNKLIVLARLGFCSLLALLPWLVIYADEIARGGLALDILNHFRNPYADAGASAIQNILQNVPTLVTSTTVLYMWALLAAVFVGLFLERTLFRTHQSLFILAGMYLPLALFQYLKSFGYLRYLIAAEFLVFILFLLVLPVLVEKTVVFCRSRVLFFGRSRGNGESGERELDSSFRWNDRAPRYAGAIVIVMVIVQLTHLFWFSNLYPSEKTQKTVAYLSSIYPEGTIGIVNVPHIGSMIAPDRKYQYLSTYGLWQFGKNPLSLPEAQLPVVLVVDSDNSAFLSFYEKDTAFSEGFSVYRKRE